MSERASARPSHTLAKAVAGRLGFGTGAPLPAGADRSPEQIVDMLGRMKFPLADLDETIHPDLDWLFNSEAFRRLREEHRSRQAAYLVEFRTFVDAARQIEMPVIALKACDAFPYESSNLDLLVPPDRMEDAAHILDRQGFLRLTHYVEPHKTLHKKFNRGREVAIFHLHQEVSWDGAIFLDRGALWKHRRHLAVVPGAAQLHPAHVAALTIAHAVYENARVGPADLRRVLRAMELEREAATMIREMAIRHGWTPGLRSGISSLAALEMVLCGTDRIAHSLHAPRVPSVQPGRSLVIRLGRMRCLLMLALKILASPETRWCARFKLLGAFLRAKARVALGMPRHRSLLVAFSGVDGAGKSMYARQVVEFLVACDIEARLLWARGGSTTVMLGVKSLLRRASRHPGSLRPREEGVALTSRWQRFLWPWVVMAELLMTYMVRLTFPLLRGRVVLLDRHVLDATVDLAERLGTRDPRNLFSWRILQRLAPHPQIHLLFDVPPEIAMQRKESGMDRAQMERRHALYRALAPSGALMIDTTRDPDLVAEEVGMRVLEAALEGLT